MALRDIIILPDKRLRTVSKPVVTITDDLRTLVADMFETMYDAPGIGLAAIQVGVPSRLVVMDLSKRQTEAEPKVFIKPGDHVVVGRQVGLRRGLPVDP